MLNARTNSIVQKNSRFMRKIVGFQRKSVNEMKNVLPSLSVVFLSICERRGQHERLNAGEQ